MRNMKRKGADGGKEPCFYGKSILTALPSHPSFPWRLLDVPSMEILSQCAATEVTLFRSKRRPNGWLRCSRGRLGLRSDMSDPLTLQERFSGSRRQTCGDFIGDR